MPKRQVFHSVRKKDGWKVVHSGQAVSAHATQKKAEADAMNRARAAEQAGGLGQAVLHKSDGVIREERTYGKDPRKSPG